jgi:hypothetical protein
LTDNDLANLIKTSLDVVYAPVDDKYYSGQGNIIDLKAEAMTSLAALGKQTLIPEAQLNDLLESQLPDGSWPQFENGSSGDSHATMLALWFLLQVKHFDQHFIPLVAE